MDTALDKDYWDKRYADQQTSWDVGSISTPLKEYIDQLEDKNISILIPGCGNAHEAKYLLENGFSNITLIDISPTLVDAIREKLKAYDGNRLKVICGDFFELNETFDLILEQTFFCALDPNLRQRYADKMFDLLKPGGKLVGLLFDRDFDDSPPFGGSKAEYEKLFSQRFLIHNMEACNNSISRRAGTELFINFRKV